MLSATVYFGAIMKHYPQTLAATAAEPAAAQQTKYFLANIAKIKTADDLVNNDRLYTYLMKAFGLSDMMSAKALIRKVLAGGISEPKSLANTLHDPRYKALAAVFNFASTGAATTVSPELQHTTVNNYVEQTLESNVRKQNQGAQMALYFQRMAPSIASAYSILADKTLLSVVQTALGLPPSMSLENIDVQARMISSKLNINDLHVPAKLQKFLNRFTASYDAQNATAVAPPPALPLFANSPGIGADLLLSLANLKLGGP